MAFSQNSHTPIQPHDLTYPPVFESISPVATNHSQYPNLHAGQHVGYAYSNQMSSYWPPYQADESSYDMSGPRLMSTSTSLQDQRSNAPSHAFPPDTRVVYQSVPPPPWSRSEQMTTSLPPAQDVYLQTFFPGDRNIRRREALHEILSAQWKIENQREPQDELLLQFTTREGKYYKCAFWRGNEKCMKEFDRKDRALDHVRTHIDLQPFICRDFGCNQRFCSKPDLLQHEKNKVKVPCDQCGTPILPKNMARHHATLACRTGRPTSSS